MNASVHSKISVRARGGLEIDYYAMHDFIDSSKEACASNLHRFLTHQMFFIKQVMIPIFGHTGKTSDGKFFNMKDMLEQDHVLADYGGKFIPTISDFTASMEDLKEYESIIKDFQSDNKQFFESNQEIHNLMMMPLWLTGEIKSLFVTHNSWFIGFILPKVFKYVKLEIKNYNISPSYFFNKMDYKPWMQNGHGFPPSFQRIEQNIKRTIRKTIDIPKAV